MAIPSVTGPPAGLLLPRILTNLCEKSCFCREQSFGRQPEDGFRGAIPRKAPPISATETGIPHSIEEGRPQGTTLVYCAGLRMKRSVTPKKQVKSRPRMRWTTLLKTNAGFLIAFSILFGLWFTSLNN